MRPEDIFLEAIDKPTPTEQSRFLDDACAGDTSLRGLVEGLLASHAAGGGFLEEPVFVTSPEVELPGPLEGPGSLIGPYKLLQEIGEGGFGVVYMAEQTLPVRRMVALKIIRPGMDTREIIARFESERQALALMEHPNIARVLDAGATATGRPYFVMELVRGVPITEYADANQLSPRERLELFIAVCGAVQHAHQKGVIHRDLKPSNILVTLHDGVPVPKVIDFGIAKATNARLTEKTLFTRYGQFVGTPAYMSPEQAEMSGLDVDTRADIYSLGILLYELLTGTTPLSAEELRAAGFAEMQRRIREVEAQRPSTRVSTLQVETRTAVAKRRRVEPDQLARALRGDLDWIVLRALEKDRTRRYETPMDLARDIGRHLRLEPVEARPASQSYRLGKLVQRNKLACGAAAVVLAALLGGLGFSLWMYGRERQAHKAALTAQQTAVDEAGIKDAVSQFLMEDVLQQADSLEQAEAGAEPRADLTVREAVERAAGRIGERFAGRPVVEAAIRATLGRAFVGLGSRREAVPHLERSLALYERELGANHESTMAVRLDLAVAYRGVGRLEEALAIHQRFREEDEPRLERSHPLVIRNLSSFAGVLRDTGRLQDAVVALEDALERVRPVEPAEDREQLSLRTGLTSLYERTGRFVEAIAIGEETLRRYEAGPGSDHPGTLDHRTILGWVYQRAGRLEQAITLEAETLARLEKVRGPEHPDTLGCKGNLAEAYRRAGRLDEARAMHQQILDLQRARLGPDHQNTLGSLSNLALTHQAAGQAREAVPLLEEVRDRLRRTVEPDHPYLLLTYDNLCTVYLDAGRWEESVQMGELALSGYRRKLGVDHEDTAKAASHLARAYQVNGRFDFALEAYRQTSLWQAQHLGAEHLETITTRTSLAAAMAETGRIPEALSLGEESLRLLEAKHGKEHARAQRARAILAGIYLKAKRPTAAEALWREQLAVVRESTGADSPAIAGALEGLGQSLVAQGRFAEAEKELHEAVALRGKWLAGDPMRFHAQSLLGASLLGRGQREEAETLLVEGYQGMKEREDKIPPETRHWLEEAIELLVKLHEERGASSEAERWRVELRARSVAPR